MKIERFSVGILGTNCYLAINPDTKEMVIIDPGGPSKKLMSHIQEEGLLPRAILLTHGHFDHIMGIDAFLDVYPVPVYIHADDEDAMNDAALNQSKTYTSGYTFSEAEDLADGQELKLAGYTFKVIHTPGHTKGGVCYYVESEGALFSGDTLFQNSVGRTDFVNSSTVDLIGSIREKLYVLPEETLVYPGHSGETTIGHEKRHNPYV